MECFDPPPARCTATALALQYVSPAPSLCAAPLVVVIIAPALAVFFFAAPDQIVEYESTASMPYAAFWPLFQLGQFLWRLFHLHAGLFFHCWSPVVVACPLECLRPHLLAGGVLMRTCPCRERSWDSVGGVGANAAKENRVHDTRVSWQRKLSSKAMCQDSKELSTRMWQGRWMSQRCCMWMRHRSHRCGPCVHLQHHHGGPWQCLCLVRVVFRCLCTAPIGLREDLMG